MLDMLSDAVVDDSQPNAIEYGHSDLVKPLVLAVLRDGRSCQITHQTNETSPVIQSKRVNHELANVKLSGPHLSAFFMTSSQLSKTYPRTANQDCQNTCRYDGPVRHRDLILLIIAKHYWNFRTGHLDDMGFDVRDGPAGQSVFGEKRNKCREDTRMRNLHSFG